MAPVDASRLFATFYAGNPTFGDRAIALSRSEGRADVAEQEDPT
jgi:hypothetical protein